MRIGWDVEKAQELMQKALDEQLTWEAIRGENTNTAKASTDKSFTGMVVEGKVSQKLVVPQTSPSRSALRRCRTTQSRMSS